MMERSPHPVRAGTFLAAVEASRAARERAALDAADAAPAEPVLAEPVQPPQTTRSPAPSHAAVVQQEEAADPVDVAQACADAGFPQLTAGLISQRATAAMVAAELDRAVGIAAAARAAGLPELADAAIRGGVSLEVFRQLVASVRPASRT